MEIGNSSLSPPPHPVHDSIPMAIHFQPTAYSASNPSTVL
jgi:hypothetical protein